MPLPIACHPFLLFLYSNIIVTTTAAFTVRDSLLRYVALVALFLLSILSPSAVSQFTKTTGWAGRVPLGATAWTCVTCLDRLILRGWDYDHYGPNKPNSNDFRGDAKQQVLAKGNTQFDGSRMDFASEVSGLARGIGRFWQVKNVPFFADANPALVPTIGAFVLVQTATIVLCYFANNIIVAATFSVDQKLLRSEYIPLLTRLSEITVPELWVRTVAIAGYWTVQYCNIQFFYSLFALLGVVFNPHDIKSWRPAFGHPKDAYTIRNFWGTSWHQNLRSGLEGVSSFLTHDLMHLPRQGILQRHTKIFFSFGLSGIMHVFSDAGGGVSMRQSGATQFFGMQALGIMMEDGVREIYKQFTGRKAGSTPTISERIIGYMWVITFLIWTSPVWVFPVTLQMREEEAMLSLSALRPFFRGLAS